MFVSLLYHEDSVHYHVLNPRDATKEINAKDPSHQEQNQPSDSDTDYQYAGVDRETIKDLLEIYTPQIVQRAIGKCKDDLNEREYFLPKSNTCFGLVLRSCPYCTK